MEEALGHLNQHSYTTEKSDATGSDSLQNSRPDKTNPFCETVEDAETNSILCKTTNIENLTSATIGVMGNDKGELFGEKTLRVEDSLQDTSKDSDGPSGDANPYKLRKEDKIDTEEVNDKEDLLRDRNLNLDISASPNDISQETCSETQKLTSEEKNDEVDDVGLKIPLVHSSSIAESGIVFSEKDHDGLTSRQRLGSDEECNKMEMENETDEESTTDKFTTDEEVIVPKYVNEGMNTETVENIGTEVAEEKNTDEDILIHEYKNQPISDLREGKCSTSSIVHIDAVSPESTDGVEIVEERIEDNATKKIGNDVSSKEAAPQYGETFSEKLEKGNSASNEKYFKMASSQDDPETGPTGISTVKVEVASEENIMPEADKDQLEVTTAKVAGYALDEQNLCTASVAEDPPTQILQTDDSVNAHTGENSDQMLHEHNHETATERQIVEKDGTFSEMPMPENSENLVANKDVELENLSDEEDPKKHEKITDNVPDKHGFQEIENATESEELESAKNRSNVGDKMATSEITERNVIDEQETHSRNEKGDSIVKEVGSDNVIFTYHSATQLTEKVHPINEEESKKLDEISDIMYDDGLSCEKAPDKADANRQILKCGMLDISEDPVQEGLMENEKGTQNPLSVSEDTYTETIANIGATNNGSGNESDDDLSIVEASGLGKEPGAPDVKISMETEELRGNSNPEKESTDMVLNVKERSQEDEKTSEVEKLNGKESAREDENLDIASEPASEDLAGETNSKATTNIHDLIDENHPEENIKTVNQYDEPETAKSKDEENKEVYVGDYSDSYELAEGKKDDKGGKQHEEKAKSGCEEKTYQTMNVENNEVNIQEEITDMEKLSVSEDEIEETSGESVGTNIHYSIDDDNLEKEITMVNQNDETEMEQLKDDDSKEMNVGDISDSHELAEAITHERVGKGHEETTTSGCEDKTNQVEDSEETNIQEEKTYVEKLSINSEPISEDQTEEINSELVATNIHDLIDDGNQEKKIITVNQNDESETEKLKDDNIKEMNVGDFSDSHELVEKITHERVGKRHEETANSEYEEEINQVEYIEESNMQEDKTYIKKIESNSEPIYEDQIEEINRDLVTTNIHGLIDDGNQEKKQNIEMVNLNDESEAAKLKDEDNKEIYDGDISGSYELAERTIHDKVGMRHEEKTNSGGEEEICQAMNVENNEVDIQKEKIDSEKVGITSETVSGDQDEENQETVATNIHKSTDDDNPEKEQNIKTATLNDDPETTKLKDEDNKEMFVGDVSYSYELAEETTHNKVGKWHEETSNSGCEEQTCQTVNVENNEVHIQEEKTDDEKLEITSEAVSEDQIKKSQEISQESVATNIHDSINDDNPEKEIIMVSKNYESETAKLKDDDNNEMNVCNLSDSHDLDEETTQERVGKRHEEITNTGCEEETSQMLDVDDNETDIVEEKTNIEKLGIDSESISGEQIEEIKSELVTTNTHGSIDNDNQELKQNIKIVNLNDEPETARLTDEENKEMYDSNVSDSFELTEGTTHNKVGKWHEETSDSRCEEETCQKVEVENNEVDIQEEKRDSEKLGITSKTESDDQIEQSQQTSQESVAADIHDSVDGANSEKEQNIEMINLNDEPETAKLKDKDDKEIYVGDISGSYELAERIIHDKVGKQHEEKTNSGNEEETCETVNVENNKVDIQKEKMDGEKVGITSETVSGNQFEESQETVATNIHNSIDDDNPEKEQNIKMVTLKDDPETAKLKDEDNKEMSVSDVSDSYELAEETTHNKVGKWHEETSNSGCEEETCQTVNVENNEIDIRGKKIDSEKLEITSQISEDQIEESHEISLESVAPNIHNSINYDNPEKEIIMVNKNYEAEIVKLEDDDNKEMNVGDLSDSHELDKEATQERVGKRHEEITNSGCEEETRQMLDVDDNDETDIMEEKTNIEKISGEETEEIKSELTNIHGSIDHDNQELKNIRSVNLNDEPETAMLTDDDNKEMNVSDASDSFELAEGTTRYKVGKRHEETSNSGCEEETCQKVNVGNNNEVDIQEEKTDSEKLGITPETVSDHLIEESQEISQESVAADIHDSVDDDNSEKENIKIVIQNDEPETAKLKEEDNKEMDVGDVSDSYELAAKLKDEDNKEMDVGDVSDSYELADGTTHNKVGKWHEEPSNSGYGKQTCQLVNVKNNNEVDIQEEKADSEKLEITSEMVSEDQTEKSQETSQEPVATNTGDLIDDDNSEKQIIRLVNLNDEPKTAKLKDENIKEMNTGDISDSRELAVEITIHDRLGKLNEETTNSGCKEETHKMMDAEESNEVDNQEETTNTEKYEITSEMVSEEQTEETNIEPVVTNFHDLIADDDNPEKEIVEVANLNVEPETVKLMDENNKQMNVSDISDSCELSQKTIYHSVGKQQEEPTNSGCEEETYEVINAEDKNEVDNLEDKMDAEKFAIATESGSEDQIEEINSESVTTTIHDSVEDEKTENKQTIEMVGLNDNPGTEKVKDDDNEERNNGDISDTPKSLEGTKHDRVDKKHEETSYTAGEEDIKQSSDSNNDTEVAVDEEGAGTKKLELISDRMFENQEQDVTYEAENAQMESTVGVCTSSNTTGFLPISDIKYEDKVQEAGSVPDLSSSEVWKSIDYQISGNERNYETLVSSLEEDVVEKAYKLDPQEKSKVFSMDERRDVNLSKKEQIPETILENPSSNVSERLEGSAEVFGQRQITEDEAILDDDSVSVRYESVKETCPDKEEYQMIEEEIPESTYRNQGDEKDDKKRTTDDKGKNSGSITIPQNPESLAEIEPVNINLSENDENRTMKVDTHEDQSHNASNICTEDGSLSHLNEERENENVDDEERRNKRLDDLPMSTILADKVGLQSDQRESTSKPEDMKDMILNEETYKIADTGTSKTNDEESISKIVENSPVMPTLVGETSEEIEERCDKAPHDPHEKQIHQGISEIDSNTIGSGVIEEDISEGTLSVTVEGETNKHFSAEGKDCSHQEREGSKSTRVKLLEEAKAIDEAGFIPGKQALDTEADKLNDECGLACKENLNSYESEKNQEEEETVKEKEMDVCLETSSNMASEKPVVAVQVESPCEQIDAATEAVKGIDKLDAESISISQENFEIKAGESSIEGGDNKNCDSVEDFHSTKEASAEKKQENNTFEDKFEGLHHGVSKKQMDILEDNTNKEQDSWESSETKELEDETQDEGNEIREEKEVSQTINMGEINQNEGSEERKNSEKSELEDVEMESTFSIVQEGLQTESGNCNRERLDQEDTDVNSEKIFHEDENEDEEATVEMESSACDTAEGATSDEPQELKSMTACKKAEDMDVTNEKTEKMVDDFSDTDSTVELVTNVEASGSHSQMHKIELPTLESIKERLQSMGTGDEGEDERCEELNTKLQEDSKELIGHEHISAIVLEGVQRTGPSEKIEEKIIIEQDISEAPRAWLKEETENEELQKDEIDTQKKKELQTECETETTNILATDSSKEEGREYDDAQLHNFPRTILMYEEEIASPVTKLEEKKNIDAAPDAYIENGTVHEQFQKDHIEAENDKPQDEQELETTCIMANESPNFEVMECDSKSEQNSVTTVLTEETETTLPKDVQGENKCSDATMNACMRDKQLQKDGIEAEKNNEPETRWEMQTTDARANKSANDGATEVDSSPSENTFMTVFTEKIRGALLLTGENEKKNLDVTPSYCVKDETNHEQLQKNNTEAEKYEEPYDKWKMETTHVTKNESPNHEVKALDSISSEQDSLSAVLTEKIKTALSMRRMDEKKNTDADPGICMKNETTNEQFEKDGTNVENIEQPQTNESPNYEVNKLDCIPLEESSVTMLSTDHLETALLMDEGNEKKNLDALSLTGSAAEEIVHEVAQKNVVSNSTLSKHTEDKATVEELAKETCMEDVIEVHKLDYSSIDSGSLDEVIDVENITVDLSARGEEVPKWATDAVQVSEDSRIETLNQEDREKIGEASRLVSKMEVDETNCSSFTLAEDEVKAHKSSTEQTTEARSPVERECTKQTEEDSNEVLEFDNSQNEEKRQDGDDLPVSQLLLEHILRNNSDIQDQTYDAVAEEKGQVAEEKGQEYDDKTSNRTTKEKQGVTLSAELEETQKKLEDPYIISEEERIHDKDDNIANAAVKEEETPESIMKYASPSLPKSEDTTDNEHISKHEDITASLPTKIVAEETRISEDRSDAEKLENASDLKIDEVNQDKKNMAISEVMDDKEQNNIQNSSIYTVVDGVKDEISGLLYEASTHDVKITNGSMKMTSSDPSGPNNDSQTTSVKTMTGNPENLNKDVEASFITKSSEDDILQDEGDDDGKVISEDLDKFQNLSHTKTAEKTRSHSETVQYTESTVQSEETVPSSQYNQTAKSSESSISEIHNHEQEEEAASKIKSEDTNEEFGKESHHEIAEIVQNVNKDSPEGPQVPDSPQVQESKLILESANEPVQIAARSMEERSIEINNDEKQIKAAPDTQIEEDNTDEEKEEDEHKIEGAEQDGKVNVDARDANSKKAHKKSHNILSSVGSKVKHSLAKVKKAITGKSSQPKATSPK